MADRGRLRVEAEDVISTFINGPIQKSTYLRPPQHHPIQQDAQLLERRLARTLHPMLLDRRQDLVVPEAGMLHRAVTAV